MWVWRYDADDNNRRAHLALLTYKYIRIDIIPSFEIRIPR